MAENPENPSSGGVKITDRRHFRSDGSPREPDAEPPPHSSTAPLPPRAESRAESGKGFVVHGGESPEEEIPGMDFATLILSFRATALMHLGLMGDGGETGEVNLDGARQMIEILSLLELKTRGNLEPEESRLLEQVLYELRLGYVNLTASPGR